MALSAGTRLGPYEVVGAIGAGGMGEVYKARDTKLHREVALKILPDVFAADPERLARFQREAQLLASLNHPNIAAIYGLEEAAGVRALVLELVEGPTLADRIAEGRVPVDEALPIVRQIADALEAAHEHNIIHRDLKPANIKVRPDGTVKVLDFGLAKLTDTTGSAAVASVAQGFSPGEVAPSQAPTLTTPAATRMGVIMGTAVYMSPEQARGKPVDKRADIWAFGCVLYEMLTGRRAFEGDDVSDTLARVLMKEPAWDVLPANIPDGIRNLLRRSLTKDRHERLHDIGDARIEINEALSKPGFDRVVSRPLGASSKLTIALIVTAAVIAAGVTALLMLTVMTVSGPVSQQVARVLISVEPAERLLSGYDLDRTLGQGRPSRTAVALSPDGRHLAYSAERAGRVQLYLRAVDQLQATPIPGTDGASNPFFSPDGQWIGFHADGALKKVPLSGGPPVTLCQVDLIYGASWGAGDVIVFARSYAREGVSLIPAAGGTARFITTLDSDAGEVSHRLPQLLPDGQTVLFTVTKFLFPNWDDTSVVAQSLVTGARKVLIEGAADARYVPTGHLVYVRRGTLMAAPFDLGRLEITGGPVGLVADVMQAANIEPSELDTGAAQFSVSESGSLAYVPGGLFQERQASLVWVGRKGDVQALALPPQPYMGPRLSPDGRRVALFITGPDWDIWIHDIPRGTLTRLAMEGQQYFPIWTPDGSHITFSSAAAGLPTALFWREADRSSPAEPLTTSEQNSRFAGSWAPEGRALAFVENVGGQFNIWVLPRQSDGQPQPVIKTPFSETYPEFSPDGRWLAYVSSESGREEVYVQPYPGLGPREQISTEGGRAPAWRRDGRELFYVVQDSGDGPVKTRVMAVPITTEPRFTAGTPHVLFEGAYRMIGGPIRHYDVSPDGQRFLMVQELPPTPARVTQLILVQHWFEELKRLLAGN